jgi:hypothetical protein
MTQPITITDCGRGPQLSTSRITVLDVFYYLHRGDDFELIHRAMPTLTREEFDVVVEYIAAHRAELIERDRRAEERIRRGIEEQRAKGLYSEIDESVPRDERIARLRAKLRERLAWQARMALSTAANLDGDPSCADRPYLIPVPRQNHNLNFCQTLGRVSG